MTDKHKVARDILSDITVHMKYARYLPEKERREMESERKERERQEKIAKEEEAELKRKAEENLMMEYNL